MARCAALELKLTVRLQQEAELLKAIGARIEVGTSFRHETADGSKVGPALVVGRIRDAFQDL